MLRIAHQWFKAEATLAFITSTSSSLRPEHQMHLDRMVGTLCTKLMQATEDVRRVKDVQGTIKKTRYATLWKQTLKEAVTELERWHTLLEPSLFLIARSANPVVDIQLDENTRMPIENSVNEQLSTIKGLRHAIKAAPDAEGINTFFLETSDFMAARMKIYYSTALITYNSKTQRNAIVNTIFCDLHSDLTKFQEDVHELARVLSQADPLTFGTLACRGILRPPMTPMDSAPPSEYDVVFDFPGQLGSPRSLRQVLNEACRRPLVVEGEEVPTYSLGERYHLEKQLARSVMFVHSCSFVYKQVRPETILLFRDADSTGTLGMPFLVGFERFRAIDGKTFMAGDDFWHRDIYRAPSRQGRYPEERYSMQNDIYSLGVCLLEIGLWTSFVVRKKTDNMPGPRLRISKLLEMTEPRRKAATIKQTLLDLAVRKLPGTLGARYTDVVVSCLTCLDGNNDTFGEAGEGDEEGIVIGVRYIEVVCKSPRAWN